MHSPGDRLDRQKARLALLRTCMAHSECSAFWVDTHEMCHLYRSADATFDGTFNGTIGGVFSSLDSPFEQDGILAQTNLSCVSEYETNFRDARVMCLRDLNCAGIACRTCLQCDVARLCDALVPAPTDRSAR